METQQTPQNVEFLKYKNQTHENIQKISKNRKIIPGGYILIILGFFFSFCDIKCSGEKIASVSGMQMVVGTEIGDRHTSPNIWAILALLSAIIGLAIFIKRNSKENLIGLIGSAIGFLSLLILQIGTRLKIAEPKEDSMGVILSVSFTFTYWLIVLLFLFTGILCYYRFKKLHEETIPPTEEKPNQE